MILFSELNWNIFDGMKLTSEELSCRDLGLMLKTQDLFVLVCGLSNDAVSTSGSIVPRSRMSNEWQDQEGCGKMQSLPNLRYCSGSFLEGSEKIRENPQYPNQDLNWACPRYQSEVLLLGPVDLVKFSVSGTVEFRTTVVSEVAVPSPLVLAMSEDYNIDIAANQTVYK